MRDRPDDRRSPGGARRLDSPLTRLTEREEEILALIAEGRSNAGFAKATYDQRANR